jgi:hypothetical protein
MTKPPWERQAWFEPYRLALTEGNKAQRLARIELAKSKIGDRITELRGRMGGAAELGALKDALTALRLAKQEARRSRRAK